MEITNRELASKFGFTLGQIKTWAVLVCGRDPQADQGGGVARSYDLDSAFKIFLCGSLVNELGIGLKQVGSFLNFIWPHLERLKLLPKLNLKERNYLKRGMFIELIIYFKPQPHCQIRWHHEGSITNGTVSKASESYSSEWIPASKNPIGPYWQYDKIGIKVELDAYLSEFLGLFA